MMLDSKSDYDSEHESTDQEDWYNASDTSEDIPDPNLSKEALYQAPNKLPAPLQKSHFEEGLIYTMTLKGKQGSMLVFINDVTEELFSYQIFFVQGSSRQTFHQTGKEKISNYNDVARLAPRTELVRDCTPGKASIGHTLRFEYGMSSSHVTICVTGFASRTVVGTLLCGTHRGNSKTFDIYEMVNCTEVFGSSTLHDLYTKVKEATWTSAPKSRTRRGIDRKPKLNPEFCVGRNEKYKRVWHILKIFGEGVDLLCTRTNERAKRTLRRRSNAYKKRWQDMGEDQFRTFLGVWLGVAIMRVGSRHLSKKEPVWLSQLGEGKLFGKLPTDLYRLYSANFVAHEHRDTVLFKKSIIEQRFRFYGNKKFSDIVYSNSRRSRDPPISISGDETITRLYTKKLTEIRMRTSKKNESGVLNQNLCGANDEYSEWKEGDPIGSGFTFANMSYPGRSLTKGSMFREKDMGNLIQLLFTCGDYLRGKDIELVTDAHFGHLVPIAWLRSMKVYVTSSFNPGQRIGVSNIAELSKVKYGKKEKEKIIGQMKKEVDESQHKFDPYEDIRSDSEGEVKEYAKTEKPQSYRSVTTPLKLFETQLQKKPRGGYKVWKRTLQIAGSLKVQLFLHAVNDSKPVFRISSKFLASPKVQMIITNKEKKRRTVATSGLIDLSEKKMGNNDQSDAKRATLGLSGMYYKRWPKHILAKTLEDGIINAYLNYLLDSGCPIEPWTVFHHNLVQELIDSGGDMRRRSSNTEEHRYLRTRIRGLKNPRPGSDEMLKRGEQCREGKHIGSKKRLQRSKMTKRCGFCGREKAIFKCRSCGTHLCMSTPRPIPGGETFLENGPPCFLRFHGLNSYPRA